MLYKNSIRILFSNFNLVWKTLLYTLVCFAVIAGASYFTAVPVFKLLLENGFFELIKATFSNFVNNLNLAEFIKGVGDISNNFVETIVVNFPNVWLSITLFLVIAIVIGRLITDLIKLPSSYVLYSSMSSNMKVGLISSFFGNAKKVLAFEFSKFIITFPIDLIIGYVIILCFKLFSVGGVISWLTPFIIIFVATILVAFRISLFSCWMPSVAVKNDNVFKCLKDNFKLINRRFFKVFATSIGIVLTIIAINGFALVFTFGVGLLVTVPLSIVLTIIFQMTAYYSSYGMRYYVDYSTIVEPKRMSATEKLKRTKYFI